MRAPDSRPTANEVARLIAKELHFSDDEIPTIIMSLNNTKLHGCDRLLTRIDKIKADVAKECRRLERLRGKYPIAYLRVMLDRAIRDLSSVAKWTGGADPRFDTLKMSCAMMAKATILDSPNKQLGVRLRTVAGFFYWHATGERDQDLERACRAVTPRKRTSGASKKRPPVRS